MSAAFSDYSGPAAGPDPDAGPRKTVMAMLLVLFLFLVTAMAWSLLAELDVAVRARGSLVPPGRIQAVQSPEGGLVTEMLVSAGQTVKKGQLLARLDGASPGADRGASRQLRLGALISRARVEALLAGGVPRFEESWRQEAPEMVIKETERWRDALREHQATGRVTREAIQRKRAEVVEAQARIGQLQATLRVGEERYAIEERLNKDKDGAGARADYLAAQARLIAQRSELDSLKQSLPRLATGLAEAEAIASEADAKVRAQWGAERLEYESQTTASNSTPSGREARVVGRELVSPVDGVVQRVLVPLQGVVAPGQPLLEVAPSAPELLMQVRVKPADIGHVRVGQVAQVRLLAADASAAGKLDAKVSRVAADAVLDEKGVAYFEVQLKAVPDPSQPPGAPAAFTPGVPVEVGVLIGRLNVLQALLSR